MSEIDLHNKESEGQDSENEASISVPMASIGAALKAAREAHGQTLEKASEITKLRPRYLRALEEEDFEVLPNKIVARGFLKIYADRLGLDVTAITGMFDAKFSEGKHYHEEQRPLQHIRPKVSGKSLVPKTLQSIAVNQSSSHQTFLTFITKQYRHYFYYALGFIGFIVLCMYITSLFISDLHKKPSEQSRGIREVQAFNTTPELLKNTKKGFDGVIVIARPLDRTWMRVYVDGVANFKGPVQRGFVKQFEGREYVRIRAGNGKAIDLLVNKKYYGKMSQEDKLVDMRFYPMSEEDSVSENETEYKDPALVNAELLDLQASTANITPPEGEAEWSDQINKAREEKKTEKNEDKKEKQEESGGWW